MSDALVTVAISTLASRAPVAESLPVQDGIDWLVLVQGGASPRAAPERKDLQVVHLETLGLSHSRNAALDLARSPYLLFADDDHTIDPASVLRLADHLEQTPELCLVAGVRSDRAHVQRLQKPHRLTRLNSGRICAPEFLVRRQEVLRRNIRFDTGFGVGARYPSGEDYIFVTDLLASGARAEAIPVVVGAHDGTSTGERWDDPNLIKARIEVLSRVFGRLSWAIRPAYAMRHRARFPSTWQALRFCFGLR